MTFRSGEGSFAMCEMGGTDVGFRTGGIGEGVGVFFWVGLDVGCCEVFKCRDDGLRS